MASVREHVETKPPPGIGDNSGAIPIPDRLAATYFEELASVDTIAGRANDVPAVITSDRELAEIAEIVRDTNKLSGTLEGSRVEEGKPYLEGQRAVNNWFGPVKDRLERIKLALGKRATVYQNEKALKARRAAEEAAEAARKAEAEARKKAEDLAGTKAGKKAADKAFDAGAAARQAEEEAKAKPAEHTRMKTESGATVSTKVETKFRVLDYEAIPLDKLRPYLKRDEVLKAIGLMVRTNKMATVLPGVEVYEENVAAFR